MKRLLLLAPIALLAGCKPHDPLYIRECGPGPKAGYELYITVETNRSDPRPWLYSPFTNQWTKVSHVANLDEICAK